MKKFLFVCSQNKLRSPTAEQVFSNLPNIEVRSAGIDRAFIKNQRIIVLNIADDYEFIEDGLIEILKLKMKFYL